MKTFTPDESFTAFPGDVKTRYLKGKTYELADDVADLYVRKGLGIAKRVPKPAPVAEPVSYSGPFGSDDAA